MRVSSCCCGCSLETGCKVIAILGLIFGIAILGLIFGGRGFINSTPPGIIASLLAILAAAFLLWGTL